MFERFTDRARRVIVLAQVEARTLNHHYIGTEHLLLGLLAEGEGVASRALSSLGLSFEETRNEVQSIIGKGSSPPTGHLPFTPRAKKVLELSLREALQLQHNYIGTEHILLGLIREGEGVAAQVLLKKGIDLGRAQAKVIEMLKGPSEWQVRTKPVGPDVRTLLSRLGDLSDVALQAIQRASELTSAREASETTLEDLIRSLIEIAELPDDQVAAYPEEIAALRKIIEDLKKERPDEAAG